MAQNMEPVLTDFIWNRYQGKKKSQPFHKRKKENIV